MTDPFASPTDQVRDGTVTVQTPSLLGAGNEPVPEEVVRDLLIEQWVETENAPRPVIAVMGDLKQVQLNRTDAVTVAVEDVRVEFQGHRHEHFGLEVPVALVIHTRHSRQRLWNLMAEVRRIIMKFILALRPYQSLYWDGFRPDYEGRAGYYSGTVLIRLTADVLPVFRPVVDGQESPNVKPEIAV